MSRSDVEPVVRDLIARFDLDPHPEGGWYRRIWTAPCRVGERASASSIIYLLDAGTSARWHRIDASELWHHAAGAPLVLSQWRPPEITETTLGTDLTHHHDIQAVVEPDTWQSARTLGDWSLVTCVVSPEFTFEGFELAPEGWTPLST